MQKLVSVRIDDETFIEAKRSSINPSNIMRELLKNEIVKRREKEAHESLYKINKMLKM